MFMGTNKQNYHYFTEPFLKLPLFTSAADLYALYNVNNLCVVIFDQSEARNYHMTPFTQSGYMMSKNAPQLNKSTHSEPSLMFSSAEPSILLDISCTKEIKDLVS